MIECQRRQGVGSSSINHYPDTIGRPFGDKGLNDGLNCLEPIDASRRSLIILCQHAGREIDRQHNVVPLLPDLLFFL